MEKPLSIQACLESRAVASFLSEGGRRILASTRGAETKRELRRARGETVSWRRLRDDMSEVLSGARCFLMRGRWSEDWEEWRWWIASGLLGELLSPAIV
jgi:hypothetical protein